MDEGEAMGTCRWCQQNTRLIRAHIIPKAFYVPIKGDADKVVILSPTERKFTRFSSSGIFDSGILCSSCDGFLGKFDEYGLRIFGSRPSDADRITEGLLPGYDLHCDDVQRAQKFLLSVLWRASVTTHDFFQTVSLGRKYEDKIRHLITNGMEITEADFEFVSIRVFDHPIDGGIVPPFRVRFGGVTAQQLYLPYYKFIVRMDQRHFPAMAALGRFMPGMMPQCLRLSYKESIESKIIGSVTERSLERHFGVPQP
jgi:hypothetical protein